MEDVSPKRRLTYSTLRVVISQKTVLWNIFVAGLKDGDADFLSSGKFIFQMFRCGDCAGEGRC
jgi:hypothetical protein